MTVANILQAVIHRVGRTILEENGEPFLLEAMNRVYQRLNDERPSLERTWYASFENSDQKLKYDALTADFTESLTVTGGTSGATGVIEEIWDNGDNSGTLILSSVSGTFEDNEALTDSSTGAATVNGANESAGYVAAPSDVVRPFRITPYREYRDPEVFLSDEQWTFSIFNDRLYVARASDEDRYQVAYYSVGKTLVRTVSDADTEVSTPEWNSRFHQLLIYETAMELSANYPLMAKDERTAKKLRSALKRQMYLKQEASPNVQGPQRRNPLDNDAYSRNPDGLR
jgi:hypothetical protein